ncbi:MAG: hypothetical protein DRH15_14465 [Deltaproteobacteria bacterium]|nr:MAG: hypothetical protein DRH15_14465 [Deltaproteobacteria bacterium]
MDPLERGMQKIKLGWLYTAMRNKFYFDELYHATFIQGAIKLADLSYNFDYNWVINPIVNLVGRTGVLLSRGLGVFDSTVIDGLVNLVGRGGVLSAVFSGFFDNKVVDGIVNGLATVTGWIGTNILRPIQTGKVQNYLLVVLISVLALLGLYLVY